MPRSIPIRAGRVAVAAGLITVALIGVALTLLNARAPRQTDATDAALVERGRAVYQAQCASCHGVNLAGQPNWKERLPSGLLPAPPHDASGHTWHHPDQLLFTIVKGGGAAVLLPGDQSGMPAFEAVLSDDDIWAVLSYIKSTWPVELQQRQTDISRQNPR